MEETKMKKTLNFGKIDYNGTGRKINLVTVEIELQEAKNGPVFTASAYVWNAKKTDIVCGGQCLDDLLQFFENNDVFRTIYSMWKKYHLNNMRIGTPEQINALKKVELWENGTYEEQCNYLKKVGLYYLDGGKTCFGGKWFYWPIPENDLETIKSLFLYGE